MHPKLSCYLPTLDPISERLISPRLPFMQIRRLRNYFGIGIIRQVVNVPVNVEEVVLSLLRQLDNDFALICIFKKSVP